MHMRGRNLLMRVFEYKKYLKLKTDLDDIGREIMSLNDFTSPLKVN